MSDHSTIQHPRWCDPAQCSRDRSPNGDVLHCSTPTVARGKDATFTLTMLRTDEAMFDYQVLSAGELWVEVTHNVMENMDSQIGLDESEHRNLIMGLLSQYKRAWGGGLLVLSR